MIEMSIPLSGVQNHFQPCLGKLHTEETESKFVMVLITTNIRQSIEGCFVPEFREP